MKDLRLFDKQRPVQGDRPRPFDLRHYQKEAARAASPKKKEEKN